MTISLGLNISSLIAQRQLTRSSDELSNVFTRLSSGQRINRASDDAAGLAIADSLNADARVYNQGVRNLNDGISVLNIADGALQELTNITFRLTELAEQAANGTLGNSQRASLDEEAQALKAEYFRIAKSTEFNGRKLFEGDYGVLSLQAGYGSDATLADGLGGDIGTGEFESQITYGVSTKPNDLASGDFNGDGFFDLAITNNDDDTVSILLGTSSGTFQSAVTYAIGDRPDGIKTADLNNDGTLDLIVTNINDNNIAVMLGNGDGTFQAAESFATGGSVRSLNFGDFNGDGNIDVAAGNTNTNTLDIFLGNGDGTFATVTTQAVGTMPINISVTDFNNDGIDDIANVDFLSSTISVSIGNGDGTFQTSVSYAAGSQTRDLVSGDFNGDGLSDIAFTTSGGTGALNLMLGNGDGSFGAVTSFTAGASPQSLSSADFNGDGILDVVVGNYTDNTVGVFLGAGDGSFEAMKSFATGSGTVEVLSEDFTNDGVSDIAVLNFNGGTVGILAASTRDGIAPLLDFSLSTAADAKQALSRFQQKLSHLTEQRGQIGAFQSRVQVAKSVLGASVENYKAAESRIRDADIAQETANLVRLNILQQAATAVLGQANQQPQLVLQLLKQ